MNPRKEGGAKPTLHEAKVSQISSDSKKQSAANALSYAILEEQMGASLARVDGEPLTEKQMYEVIPTGNRIPKYVVDVKGKLHAVYVYRAKSQDVDILLRDLKEIAEELVNAQKALRKAVTARKVKKDFTWERNVVHVLVAKDEQVEVLIALCEKVIKEQKSSSAVEFIVTKTKSFFF